MDNKAIKRFSRRSGEVFVNFDGYYYAVTIVQPDNKRTGCPGTSRTFMRLDYAIAKDYYAACVNLLKGKPWVEPRTFCALSKKMCLDYNCPRKIGGADYHRIFSESCPHRIQGPFVTKQR